MKIEPLNILVEKGSKDLFNKKCCIDETGFACITPMSDLLLCTTTSVGLQLIQVKYWFLIIVG